jgi:hypothetical protein
VSVKGRLLRLGRRLRPGLCPECRGRHGGVVLVSAGQPRGDLGAAADGAPGPCGRCGAVPELVVEVAEEVVGDGVDVG